MMSAAQSTLLRVLALAGMAGAAALVSNVVAPPARRLAWVGSRPPLPVALPPPERPVHVDSGPQPSEVRTARDDRPLRPAPHTGARVATPAPAATREAQGQVATSPIREINSQEAWEAFQSGAPFLDARRSSEFAEGHIARAWCTPVWESDVDDRLIAFKAARRPGPEDPIVIYCSGGDCRDSHLLAAKLLNEGYFHLLIYRDGFPAWMAQGHPIEKGLP